MKRTRSRGAFARAASCSSPAPARAARTIVRPGTADGHRHAAHARLLRRQPGRRAFVRARERHRPADRAGRRRRAAREPGDPDRRATPRATCCSASTTTCSRRQSRKACSSLTSRPSSRGSTKPTSSIRPMRSRRSTTATSASTSTWAGSMNGPSRRPSDLGDLTDGRYRGLTVVENPATSTPGLAFLLATIARFGDDGWQAFWRDLRANDALVVDGWEQAYFGEFSGAGGGEGERPIVVSYATSPVAEVVFAEEPLDRAPTAAVTESCYRQVEFAGVLAGTEHPARPREVIDFLLSRSLPGRRAPADVRLPGGEGRRAPRGVRRGGPRNPSRRSPCRPSRSRPSGRRGCRRGPT